MSDSNDTSEPAYKRNIKRRETWLRGAYILLFAIIYGVAEALLVAVVLFQFGSILLAGQTNERLHVFSRNLCEFIYQVLSYVTFNSDDKPFPFDVWPDKGKTPLPLAKKKATKKSAKSGDDNN